MKNYDDNDDPIQEVGKKNIFSRMKSFENDLGYKIRKEMEEFEKYLDEEKLKEESKFNSNEHYNPEPSINYNTGNKNKSTNSLISFYIIIYMTVLFMIGFTAIFITSFISSDNIGAVDISQEDFYINPNIEREQMDYYQDEEIVVEEPLKEENEKLLYNGINLAELEVIIFANGSGIPALYKFDKTAKANWCKYIVEDTRFNKYANVIEINYEYIPTESVRMLKEELLRGEFLFVGKERNGDAYVLDTGDNHYVFAIISNTNIIYGGGVGEYSQALHLINN